MFGTPSRTPGALMHTDVSRRGFLGGMTAAAGWLATSWVEIEQAGAFAAAATPQEPYKVLNTEQVRLLDAASAQIVPTDELPGAREARVVRFMDRALSTFAKDQWPAVQQALKDLTQVSANWSPGKNSFLELN